jgi:hypothetical protein
MTWNLFLDDERYPPNDGREWVIARSVDAALDEIGRRGMPSYISFDHDLGSDQPTGYELVKTLIAEAIDFPDIPGFQFPDDFSFYVHSQNPIGKANIEGLLNGYLELRE